MTLLSLAVVTFNLFHPRSNPFALEIEKKSFFAIKYLLFNVFMAAETTALFASF